ncbi:hypothetical protein Syun_014004 [Stephania yunnanensis]|uniref:Uncharacterized protein n=1 Tax=Stephania yunnanensis TaxID=152371 RepID=A0AAP0JIX6_9MAGN
MSLVPEVYESGISETLKAKAKSDPSPALSLSKKLQIEAYFIFSKLFINQCRVKGFGFEEKN